MKLSHKLSLLAGGVVSVLQAVAAPQLVGSCSWSLIYSRSTLRRCFMCCITAVSSLLPMLRLR